MGKQYLQAKVNNLPKEVEKYVVVKIEDDSRELWYWGTWAEEDGAVRAAKKIDGIVLERMD